MPDAIITSTESTFGTISGTFAADQSTITGTISGIITGTLDGSVGVPGPTGQTGPQGPQGEPGEGVPAGGLAGQFLQKTTTGVDYATDWVTVNLGNYLVKSNNLSDLTDVALARSNLELGTLNNPTFAGLAIQGAGANLANLGATYLTLNHSLYGSFSIDAASGITFPDTTVQTTAFTSALLTPYAPLNSPLFTGDPRGPTAPLADNDTSLATTAFVQQELASGVAVAKNLEVLVRNQSGSTIAAGSIVYISGATGNKPLITLAQANNDANSAQTMGFVKTAIADNGTGYVIVRGEVENLDTSALTEGVQLYLSPTTAGTWTTTKPSAPQHLVYVGIVIRSHPTQGVILVAVQNGYELNELHDVAISSPTNGQVLKYDSATNLWKNQTDSSGVAWGGITGTLSSQLDLQSALDSKYSTTNPAGYITSAALTPYLLSSTAASTYYPLTNPAGYITSSALAGYATESWVTSQGYITSAALSPYLTSATAASTYLTQSNAASTYYLQTNPAGYITSAALSGYATESWVTSQGYLTFAPVTSVAGRTGAITLSTSDISGLGTMATASASDYSTTTVANGLYYPLSSNPAGYLTSAPVTSVAGRTGAVTLSNTDISGLGTLATVNDAPSDGNEYVRKNAAWSVATGGGGGGGVDVQTFGSSTTSGSFTWTKPAGAKWVEVILMAGGGGGGSGRRDATTLGRSGGGGASSGAYLIAILPADSLSSTETVVVGAGGTGGASITTDGTSGSPGNSGGNTTFFNLVAIGGLNGFGGTSTTGIAGTARTSWFMGATMSVVGSGGTGQAGSGTNVNTAATANAYQATPAGGGAGAGASSTSNANGGNGGSRLAASASASGFSSATAGGAGGVASTSTQAQSGASITNGTGGGTGGGGGFYRTGTAGGTGGNGGWPAGGGGGGGASDNGFNSGAGGDGANGYAVIITYF